MQRIWRDDHSTLLIVWIVTKLQRHKKKTIAILHVSFFFELSRNCNVFTNKKDDHDTILMCYEIATNVERQKRFLTLSLICYDFATRLKENHNTLRFINCNDFATTLKINQQERHSQYLNTCKLWRNCNELKRQSQYFTFLELSRNCNEFTKTSQYFSLCKLLRNWIACAIFVFKYVAISWQLTN